MNAYVHVRAGASGLEATAAAMQIHAMEKAWALRLGYEVEEIRELGFIAHGADAYERLRAEDGLHRVVRNSPFDPDHRRHTCFIGVTVRPVGGPESDGDGPVRSYVFDPYRLVKDCRSGAQTEDVGAVLAGDLGLLEDGGR